MLFLRIFVAVYGCLTIASVVEEVLTSGWSNYHLVYIALSLALLAYAFQVNWVYCLHIGLIGLILFAIYIGIQQNILQISHIVIRTVISLAVIYFHHHLS